jgi:hypothetical protein
VGNLRYLVTGEVIQHVTVEVDANSIDEAIEIANDMSAHRLDVWDTDIDFYEATAVE